MANSQLTLGLALRDDATFENFCVGSNLPVLDALKRCLSLEGEQIIYLWGTDGVGCSHLLQACCHAIHEAHSAVYIDLEDYRSFSPAILEDLEQIDLVCLDHIHAVLNLPQWEEAIFHFYNRMREQSHRLVVAGKVPPSQLPCQLADLRSRLTWGLVFQIKALNDTQKLEVLMTRARNRGMILAGSAAQYLLNHSSRNLSDLFRALDHLEKFSLVEQRRITVPFIKSVL